MGLCPVTLVSGPRLAWPRAHRTSAEGASVTWTWSWRNGVRVRILTQTGPETLFVSRLPIILGPSNGVPR